jgi:UPF0716 protein FxsA
VCGVLAVLFVVVPAIEIFVLLQVGSLIGLWPTLGIIVVTALIGAWLAKHQGFFAVRELQKSMLTGRSIGSALLEAALILVAGVVMMTPGFVTDAFGLALLVPQTRRVIARSLRKGLERRIARGDVVVFPLGGRFPGAHDPNHDHDRDRDGKPPVIDV